MGGPIPTPPNKGGKGKWILGGLALVAVIVLTIAGTVMVLRPDSDGGNGPSSNTANGNSEFASANDTGPANIITDDPTCAAWGPVARDYVVEVNSVKWADRDSSVPATAWTPDQRTMYETVGDGMTRVAKLTSNLVKRTPHRVMRELYRQYILYAEAFVDRIPTYEVKDDNLAAVADRMLSAVAAMCSAIEYKSAPRIAPLTSEPLPPSKFLSPDRLAVPQKFIATADSTCSDWISVSRQFDDDIRPWLAVDAKIPASEWTPEQKSINDNAGSVMAANADEMERLGRQSGNAIFEDFAVLTAQYRRAFVVALPNYETNDFFLTEVASALASSVNWACRAAS